MKHLIVLIFLGIVIESRIVLGQRLNNDNENEKPPSATVNADDDAVAATVARRPTGNFNGRFRKVLKVKKEKNNQESLPAGKRLNRTPYSEDSSVSASSSKNSFTVNNSDDDDDYFSRRRAQFLFRQRVGK